jgi:hypothetical protein
VVRGVPRARDPISFEASGVMVIPRMRAERSMIIDSAATS